MIGKKESGVADEMPLFGADFLLGGAERSGAFGGAERSEAFRGARAPREEGIPKGRS